MRMNKTDDLWCRWFGHRPGLLAPGGLSCARCHRVYPHPWKGEWRPETDARCLVERQAHAADKARQARVEAERRAAFWLELKQQTTRQPLVWRRKAGP